MRNELKENFACSECGHVLPINYQSSNNRKLCYLCDVNDDDEDDDNFQPCDDCDLPDACSDFGCAIKNGVRSSNRIHLT